MNGNASACSVTEPVPDHASDSLAVALWASIASQSVGIGFLALAVAANSWPLAIFAAPCLAIGLGGQVSALMLAIWSRVRRSASQPLVEAVVIGGATLVGLVTTIRFMIVWDEAQWGDLRLSEPAVFVVAAAYLLTPLVVPHSYRFAALVPAGLWLVVAIVAWYANVSRMDVGIDWAGPAPETHRPAIYWAADASGDFTVRLGGSGCGDGRVIESGRYDAGTLAPDESRGRSSFTEIPLDALESDGRTTIRVCIRSGIASGSAERWVDAEGTAHRF